jgi:NADH:ubiquinone oxidoreductase subunit 2 (subunit N)
MFVGYLSVAMGVIAFLIWVTVIGITNTEEMAIGGVVSSVVAIYFYYRLNHLLKRKAEKEAEENKEG